MNGGSSPWWRTYFDDDFFTLHEPLFPESESRAEVGAMIELLALHAGARVLDVPCGWGRHTRLFAQAGYHAVGADLSLPLLERAPGATASAGAGVDAIRDGDAGADARYAAADLRGLPFRDGAFDAVLNVFTSLGLFLNDEDDLRALREARRVLRTGGKLLLESMHRDDVIRGYAERDRWLLPDGTEVRVQRRFDPVQGVSHERLRWRAPDGTMGRKRHALKLRTATEIDALLDAAGFAARSYFGGWDGAPLRYDSEHLVVVAERGP